MILYYRDGIFSYVANNRGLGRAMLIGNLGGVAGQVGLNKKIKKWEAEGLTPEEIRQKAMKRAALIGGSVNAVTGMTKRNASPRSVVTNIVLGAGGALAGASKKVEHGHMISALRTKK